MVRFTCNLFNGKGSPPYHPPGGTASIAIPGNTRTYLLRLLYSRAEVVLASLVIKTETKPTMWNNPGVFRPAEEAAVLGVLLIGEFFHGWLKFSTANFTIM
jgi:hypothetical protein